MKKIYQYFLLTFFMLSLASCEKDDEDMPGQLSAKVDNVAWQADGSILAVIDNRNGDNLLIIFAKDNKNEEIIITAKDVTGTGTYTDATDPSRNHGQYTINPNKYWYSLFLNSFSVTITKFDQTAKKISGTFRFQAEAAHDNSIKSITDGVFTNVSFDTY